MAAKSGQKCDDAALVLAAHGDRGGEGERNQWLFDHAEEIASRGLFGSVAPGFLKGEPAIEVALAEALGKRIVIYPLFMADGYFMRVLRERIAAIGLPAQPDLLPVLGEEPDLPGIMLARAVEASTRNGWAPQATGLLVAAHGSQVSRANADAAQRIVGSLAAAQNFSQVSAAFIEEPPLLRDALAQANMPTVVVGFLSGEGMHAEGDVPRAIAETGARAVYTGAIGADPAMRDLIVNAAVASA